jgi:hypothetical protein
MNVFFRGDVSEDGKGLLLSMLSAAVCRRSAQDLIGSNLRLLGLDLAVPGPCSDSGGPVHLLADSTGLRLSGPGEWFLERHGTQRRRAWRKLHIGWMLRRERSLHLS